MKAKKVYENIDFKRGIDPKDAILGTDRHRILIERVLKDFADKYKAGEYRVHEGIEGEIVGMVSDIKKHPYTVFKIQWFPKKTSTNPGRDYPPRTYIGEIYRYKSWRKATDTDPMIMGSNNIQEVKDWFEENRLKFRV